MASNTYQPHPAISRWRTGKRGGHTTLNEAWRAQIARDPDLRDAILCVDLVFGFDHSVRLATRDCRTVSTLTGRTYQWQGVLDDGTEIAWEYTPGDPTSSARSLTLSMPNAYVDAAAIVRQTRILSGIAEVSLQLDGGDYDDRLVLIRGDLTDIEFGAIDQLVTCSIADPRDSVDLHLPPYTLTTERFSTLIDVSVGNTLAIVMPSFDAIPGHFLDGSTSAPDVVVAHGHLTIGEVYVDGALYASGSTVYPWSTLHGIDLLGEPYTAISFSGGTGAFDGEGGEKVYAKLSGGPTDGHPVRVIRRIVEHFTTLGRGGADPYLFARAEARAGFLRGRLCANASGSGNESAISFIEGTFLESFPMISMAWAFGGYGPIYTDRSERLPAVRLVADQHPILDRASRVAESPKSECFNTFSIAYDYSPMEDEYRKYAERTPNNSAGCELSRRTCGERHADTIESLFITDDAVAARILDWLVSHRTMPHHDVDYDVSPSLILRLVLGDNVALDDDEFGWSDSAATVRRLVYRLARGTLGLRVWNETTEIAGAARFGGASSSGYAPVQ